MSPGLIRVISSKSAAVTLRLSSGRIDLSINRIRLSNALCSRSAFSDALKL
jgi:hypothetical protein